MSVIITFYRYNDKYFMSHLDTEITVQCKKSYIRQCIKDFLITETLRGIPWNAEYEPSVFNFLELVHDAPFGFSSVNYYKKIIEEHMKGICVPLKIDFKIDTVDDEIIHFNPCMGIFDNLDNMKINEYLFTHRSKTIDIENEPLLLLDAKDQFF